MTPAWNKTTSFAAGFLAALLIIAGLWYAARGERSRTTLHDAAQGVAMHDAKTKAPPKAYDKDKLRERGVISKETARNPEKEVLAVAEIKDDSGTLYVGAELDAGTGVTQQTATRSVAEWMDRWEAGLGYGLVQGDTAKGAQLRFTFGRAWALYGTAQIEIFGVDRLENRHPWTAMVWATGRF